MHLIWLCGDVGKAIYTDLSTCSSAYSSRVVCGNWNVEQRMRSGREISDVTCDLRYSVEVSRPRFGVCFTWVLPHVGFASRVFFLRVRGRGT